MEIICENLATCGFFKKYGETKSLACKGLIAMYCKSEKMVECKRLEYIEVHKESPPPEMMPNGMAIKP